MQKNPLGKTGIPVSRMCFGALTIGPLQANLSLEEGAQVLAHALERGVNFVDTAQLYETYPYIRRAMERTGKWDLIISSKTYAYTRKMAVDAVEQARRALNRDVIDIFMLHEQESIHTLRGHWEALEYLWECKQKGIVKAVGASMHHIAAVEGAIEMELDVIHPLLNMTGIGIADGTRDEMEAAVRRAHAHGIGVYSMKPLGGGNLFRSATACLQYVLGLDCVDSVAIGMQSLAEVDANLEFWATGAFTPQQRAALDEKTRRLHIDDWCEGCGKCVAVCKQNALCLRDNKAVCDNTRCVLCGYCAPVCPAWAIKVV